MNYRITSCGKFHFAKYAKYLQGRNVEMLISHKVSTLRRYPWVKNLWLKEYAFYGVAKLLPSRLYLWAYYVGHFFWNRQLSSAIENKVDVDYFLCHGNCGAILKNRRYRSIRVAHVVNAHPKEQERLLGIAKSQLPERVWRSDHSNDYFERHAASLISEAQEADYVTCPSNFVRDSFVQHGFAPDRVLVLPYALDRPPQSLQITRPAMNKGRLVRIVCVGQVMMRKGQHVLLLACQALRREGYRIEVTLVGREFGAYFNYLRDIDPSFQHVRHLCQADLFALMRAHDLFVLPSFEDGFAVVVAEALGQGLPVIVSRSVGAMETLHNSNGGSVFEPGDVNDLVEKLKLFFEHGYEEEIVRAHTWADYANELLALLKALPGVAVETR